MAHMKISLVYIRESQQILRELVVNSPCSVRQAIEYSTILRECPEINLAINKVGIFGHRVSLETRLNEGDRVEIYRPLKIDPKEIRRLRALRK